MKLRLVLAAGLVGAMSFASMSNAAVRQSCNLVVDDKGDTDIYRDVIPYDEPAYDILSADLASDAKTITGVIRVAKMSKTVASSPYGVNFEFNFLIPGSDLEMYLVADSNLRQGDRFIAGYRDSANLAQKLADVTGVWDEAKNEIRIHAPISAFAAQGNLKPGAKISGMIVQASRHGVAVSVFADVAEGAKTYTAGARSCVKPGK